MSIDIEKYSEELRILNDAYYNQHLSYAEYQLQRRTLFDKIEQEMHVDSSGTSKADTGLLDKVLSHFKNYDPAG